MRRWRELLATLGESLVEVAEAEVSALKLDLRSTGRRFVSSVALAIAAAILAFWVVGAASFALFQVLLLWLPGWGASLIVLGALVLIALILGWIARQRFGELEAPMDTVRRRVEDHKDWWQNDLLAPGDRDARSQIGGKGDTERHQS